MNIKKDADVRIGVLFLLCNLLQHWEKLPFRSRFSGVYCENWESFANRLRREKAAGTARPEGKGCGHCPPGGKWQRGLPAII